MTRVFVLSLSVFLAACTSPNVRFTAKDEYPIKNIKWQTAADINQFCADLIKKPAPIGRRYLGCAEYDKYICTIYTGKKTDLATLGHETRHCFEGKWHD